MNTVPIGDCGQGQSKNTLVPYVRRSTLDRKDCCVESGNEGRSTVAGIPHGRHRCCLRRRVSVRCGDIVACFARKTPRCSNASASFSQFHFSQVPPLCTRSNSVKSPEP